MSNRRWRRGESRQRLLDTALEAIAEAGPSGVSGRKIAKAAGVQHPQIQQMFGSVDALLEASLIAERDRFMADVFDVADDLPDPFAIVDYPNFWRAIAQVVLDPGPIDLAELAAGGPVQRVESELGSTVGDSRQRTAAASAWVATPLGFLVFEDVLQRGLRLSPEELAGCRDRIRRRLTDLTNGAASSIVDRDSPPVLRSDATHAPTTAREQLVRAAQDLLASRLETSVRGRELAEHAEVNYGLINHYFGSKAAVFDEALIELHSQLVEDAVRGDVGLPHLGGPDVFTRHRTFIRAWASRLIGGRATPDFELTGLRALIERTRERRGPDADRIEVIGDALAGMSLGLGWAILSPLPTAGGHVAAETITRHIYRLHYWLLEG